MPIPSQRTLKVFLCHASVDKPKVRELYRYLRQQGMNPWLDAEDLLPGQKWQIEIPKALETSDAIIICISKNSVDKEGYVQKEIKFALDKALEIPEDRIFLIPARLEDCEPPYSLKDYQWVNLFEDSGYSRLTKALKKRAQEIGLESPTSPSSRGYADGIKSTISKINRKTLFTLLGFVSFIILGLLGWRFGEKNFVNLPSPTARATNTMSEQTSLYVPSDITSMPVTPTRIFQPATTTSTSISRDEKLRYISNNTVYEMDLMTKSKSKIVDLPENFSYWGSSWSLDGQTIIYSALDKSELNPQEFTDIFAFNLSDSAVKQLTHSNANDDGAKLSPDKTKLLLESLDTAYIVDVDGEEREPVYPRGISGGVWSPDSHHIVYSDDGRLSVLDVSALTSHTLVLGESYYCCDPAAWSPNGEKLVYTNYSILMSLNFDGTNKQKLWETSATWYFMDLEWSPDGSMIALTYGEYVNNDRNDHLVVLRADGEELFNSTCSGYCYDISWSKDSQKIAASNSENIFVFDKSGAKILTIQNGSNPFWMTK